MRHAALVALLAACSSAPALVVAADAGDGGGATEDASTPDGGPGPDAAQDTGCGLPPASAAQPSPDCRPVGPCLGCGGIEFRCSGGGAPSDWSGRKVLDCFDIDAGAFCCPPSCVRRSSRDGMCSGTEAYDCAQGATHQPLGCSPASAPDGGLLCCNVP